MTRAATCQLAFIGFGEAAMAFAEGLGGISAYDRKTATGALRDRKLADFARFGVSGSATNGGAVSGIPLILSLVTADRALEAARETARAIAPGALYCDMNSVAPATKRAAAEAIERAGALYADVAVMAPVDPGGRDVPLLIAGPYAAAARAALTTAGFGNIAVITGPVGAASSVKMIRSVIVKGIEALTAECVIAADAAGVLDAVIASLDASSPDTGWRGRADYSLDRMMTHGLRRAAEMDEVVATLAALGCDPVMSRGTAERQRALGRLGIVAPDGLAAKLAALRGRANAAAAA